VPPGSYVRPRIVDAGRLHAAAEALASPGVSIECAPFDGVNARARPGDFVYFDPPYAPLGPTSSFRQYTARGFSHADQERLHALAIDLAARGVRVLLSNSSAASIEQLYGGGAARSAGLRIRRVAARRAINSRADRRGPVDELIVSNLRPVA
jgi:DNA adenine methylase